MEKALAKQEQFGQRKKSKDALKTQCERSVYE